MQHIGKYLPETVYKLHFECKFCELKLEGHVNDPTEAHKARVHCPKCKVAMKLDDVERVVFTDNI